MVVAWTLLMGAIAVEVLASAALPKTQGFRDPGWTAAVVAGYAFSIWLLTLVIRHIPVSITYAVWAGLGTAGIAVVGVLPRRAARHGQGGRPADDHRRRGRAQPAGCPLSTHRSHA